MVKATLIIKNETGLHARPASQFVTTASGFKSDVLVKKEGKEYNAKSILGLLSMGAGKGDEVTIITDGEDEENALQTLVQLVENLKG